MIFIKNFTNWLMPIGARLCNLNIQLNSDFYTSVIFSTGNCDCFNLVPDLNR